VADKKRKAPKRGPRGKDRGSKLGLWTVLAIAVLLGVYAAFIFYVQPSPEGEELTLTRFVQLVDQERVVDARFLDQDGIVVGTYVDEDGSTNPYHARYPQASMVRDNLVQSLISTGARTDVDQQFLKQLLVPATLLFPALILVVIFIYLLTSYRRGTGLFGLTSGARRAEPDATPVTFADVAGQDAAVDELREIAGFLSEPERFAAVGAKVPRGILLYGPPGCGKTLIARALAGEAGAAFYSISGSDFVEMYVGVGASRVRDLFREARENAPAIVFIDELDAVGRRRSGSARATAGASDEHDQTLNQILAELDGFSPLEGIILIGATNRPDVLDPALLRPGRFDRAVGLERPDQSGRLAILEVHASGKPLDSTVDLVPLARDASGLTGADLASVVNEAALQAARARKPTIGQSELRQALERVKEEPERQRRLALRDRSIGAGSLAADRVTFDDVAGVREAIEELRDVRAYLDDAERFAAMGARPSRGFLLVGPPGCGKTLLARAVAGEANATFLSVAATEFTEVFVGEGAARVRDLFAQARTVAPAIIFIDEIDAIGARRGAGTDGHRERESTLNQILIELDGFGPRSGVIVMAASNRAELLDPALVRPGRFDRTIAVELPDRAGRREILELHAQGKPLATDVDLDAIAGMTRGMSGADLANILNEAALLAARRQRTEIPAELVEHAIERASLGIGRTPVLTDEERTVVAYHEAGHVVVIGSVADGRLPHRVSIVGHGRALGGSWQTQAHDQMVHSRSRFIEEMAVCLGGKVAEELVFGEATSGSGSDLTRVRSIARRMVCELGMSERLGALSYTSGRGDPAEGYSEETARLIDEEVRRIVAEADDRARALVGRSRDALERVARALLERETLSASDLQRLLAEPTSPERGDVRSSVG